MKIKINDESFLYDVEGLVNSFYKNNERDDLTLFVTVRNPDKLSRKELKNEVKRICYKELKRYSKRELPWGTLSGIRPVKIARNLLEGGTEYDEALKYMKDTYLLRDEKAVLSLDIAKKEIEILEKSDKNRGDEGRGYSIYIGVPFCDSRCLYCSFPSNRINRKDDTVEKYIKALKKEIDLIPELFYKRPVTSVYFGGGTPTALNEFELYDIISYLNDKVLSHTKISSNDNFLEFSVEAGRPDSITKEKLKVLKELGVNRLSVNPQTLNEKTLKIIGRNHTVKSFYDAFYLTKGFGFDSINTDIIIGLPGESIEDLFNTLNGIKALDPDCLTVHSLAIKRSSRLSETIDDYKKSLYNSNEHIALSQKMAKEIGMLPYYLYRQQNMAGNLENTGFSKPGKECVYNIEIIEEDQDIVALGPGAACKKILFKDKKAYKTERCENVKDVSLYIKRIDEMMDRKRELYLKDI